MDWAYACDVGGNLTERTGVGTYSYDETSNRTLSAGGKPLGYDAAGNVVQRMGAAQAFDARGRLESVRAEDGTELRFRYDYAGQRAVKEVWRAGQRVSRTVYVDRLSEERDGVLNDFVFLGSQRVAQLQGDPRAAAVGRTTGALQPLAWGLSVLVLAACILTPGLLQTRPGANPGRRRRLPALALTLLAFGAGCRGCEPERPATSGQTLFLHADHLGSTVLTTDEGGTVTSQAAYTPYGSPLAETSQPYGFAGEERDAEAGLQNLGARAYDPLLGRFTAPDPLFLTQPERCAQQPTECNLYAYARNAPTRWVDPSGTAGEGFQVESTPTPRLAPGAVRTPISIRSPETPTPRLTPARPGLVPLEAPSGVRIEPVRAPPGPLVVLVLAAALFVAGQKVARDMRDAQDANASGDRYLGSDTVDNHRNAHLAGKRHEITKVPFNQQGMPVFDSLVDVELPEELRGPDVSDYRQFKYATQRLLDDLMEHPERQQAFTLKQMSDIFEGKARIDGLTWHHNEDGITLQLVDRVVHELTGHCGGRWLTGGRPHSSKEQ